MPLSDGQRLAVEQLREIERASLGSLELPIEPADPGPGKNFLVQISVLCRSIVRAPSGLPLRDRESFYLLIPPSFPFVHPTIFTVHTRFAGFEHVQWQRQLCLYQAPETEWDPSDGMYGFVTRLVNWLELGARNEFEPAGEPLHPPAIYADVEKAGMVIPRIDTPQVGVSHWFGTVHLDRVHDQRVDIVAWTELGTDLDRAVPPPSGGSRRQFGAAVLLNSPLPFEYPLKISELLAKLEESGVSQRLFLLTLVIAALHNEADAPLYVVIGTPMRGTSGGKLSQHLAVWRLDAWAAAALRIMSEQFSESGKLREIGGKAEAILLEWASTAAISWSRVREARAEVTIRRDRGTAVDVFAGRKIAVWGCGALGGHVAEYLTRAGAKKLILRDHGDVAPGILVRQPFEDRDIGLPKAKCLAERLRRMDPTIEIVYHFENVLTAPLDTNDWTEGADFIIDATASVGVLKKFELCRRRSSKSPVPVVSMVVDHKAERGFVVVSGAAHSGGLLDVTRRAKVEVCGRAELSEFANAFWPESSARPPIFQPEPGCSANTFVGSAADLAGLAATMLNIAARDLQLIASSSSEGPTARARLIVQPHVKVPAGAAREVNLAFPADVVSFDPEANYEIRIARSAWSEMQGWIQRSRRTLGATVETGGVLFGQRDDACRVVWVDEVIGPPPDSSSAPEGFVCGVEGVADANTEKRHRTRSSVSYIGMWHTHPTAAPLPSATDLIGMHALTNRAGNNPPRALLVIVGRTVSTVPALGTFLFSRQEFESLPGKAGQILSAEESNSARRYAQRDQLIYTRVCNIIRAPKPLPRKSIGLALSGGGARAIAFHLGCLRALKDRGILDQIGVLSTVSGGSVIGAMYAYTGGDFTEFDRRVVHLLRTGISGRLSRRIFAPSAMLGSLATAGTAGIAAVGADLLRLATRTVVGAVGMRDSAGTHWSDRIQPPLRRWRSRTTTFEALLREQLFGETTVSDVARPDLDVVINATELSTGTAFRFSNRGSGGSRFGRIVEPAASLALAVACSAAYPALLPAIDRRLRFVGRNDEVTQRRVLLTDGGVYDNLGTLPMEPGRQASISEHVFPADYIISCDAGVGVISGASYPYYWLTRMYASFETLFRRVQNTSRSRLHDHVAYGRISGFMLPYLAQRDAALPWSPPDLVSRARVVNYPTNFSPMSAKYIELLSTRGEQLTRLLIDRYCRDL